MDLNETLTLLEQVHENFRLVVGANGTAEGNLRSGHAICSTCPQEAPPTDTGGIPPGGGPPPPPTGACCAPDGTCTTDTAAHCTSSGGTYQGDGTPCTPNPCTGPPPDLCPDCSSFFSAWDGSGRKFLTYNRSVTGNWNVQDHAGEHCEIDLHEAATCSASFQSHYNIDCVLVVDNDTSHSHRDGTIDSGDPCDRPSLECFCNVVIPDHNLCTSAIGYCISCGMPSPSVSTSTTATVKTTTWTWNGCSGGSCGGCSATGTYVVTETLSNECPLMELGTAISKVATPIAGAIGMDCYDPATQDLRPESNCAKMRDDFNNAQHVKDYANAILDRIRKRGKYQKET